MDFGGGLASEAKYVQVDCMWGVTFLPGAQDTGGSEHPREQPQGQEKPACKAFHVAWLDCRFGCTEGSGVFFWP